MTERTSVVVWEWKGVYGGRQEGDNTVGHRSLRKHLGGMDMFINLTAEIVSQHIHLYNLNIYGLPIVPQ